MAPDTRRRAMTTRNTILIEFPDFFGTGAIFFFIKEATEEPDQDSTGPCTLLQNSLMKGTIFHDDNLHEIGSFTYILWGENITGPFSIYTIQVSECYFLQHGGLPLFPNPGYDIDWP